MTFFLITKTLSGLEGNSRSIERFETLDAALEIGINTVESSLMDGDAMENDFLDNEGDLEEAIEDFKSNLYFSAEFMENELEVKIVEVSDADANAFERGFNS